MQLGATDIPYSVSEAHLHILGVDLVVHHLSDGQRIIDADGINALLEAMAGGGELTPEDAMKLAKVVR